MKDAFACVRGLKAAFRGEDSRVCDVIRHPPVRSNQVRGCWPFILVLHKFPSEFSNRRKENARCPVALSRLHSTSLSADLPSEQPCWLSSSSRTPLCRVFECSGVVYITITRTAESVVICFIQQSELCTPGFSHGERTRFLRRQRSRLKMLEEDF